MLSLLFRLEPDVYALDCREIAEVRALPRLKQLPGAPGWVAGLLDHDGAAVPVIDLCALALGRPAHDRLSTRLVLVHYPAPGAAARPLGLIVERGTEFLRSEAADWADSGMATPDAPYLGPVLRHERGLIQQVHVAELLPAPVRALLYGGTDD